MQPLFDELVAWATVEPRRDELIAARAEFFKLTGEVFEDDKQFEMRMASFLEHYVCDRVSPLRGKTPAVEYHGTLLVDAPDRAAAFLPFTRTVHGLFEVKKLKPGLVRLRELFSGDDYDVSERRAMVGLGKGYVLEARLIPTFEKPDDDVYVFSSAFCCHLPEASDAIRKEVKRRKKHEPTRPPIDLVYDCARRALKADRYRQIAIEKIYDFVNPTV